MDQKTQVNDAVGADHGMRERLALGLMLLSALGALYGFVSSVATVTGASLATQQVEAWRMIGFLMFSGVFVLLGLRPRLYPYLWELTIANKVVLTLAQLILISRATNAMTDGVVDALVSVFLILAYTLSRGYESWRRAR